MNLPRKISSTFLIFVLALGLFACKTNVSATNTPSKASLSFVCNLTTETASRTIFPEVDFSSYNYTVSGKKDGGTESELLSNVAYSKLSAQNAITVEPGKWTFTITALKNGSAILSGNTAADLIAGSQTLSVTMKAVSEGTGHAEITLTFPSDKGVTKVTAGIYDSLPITADTEKNKDGLTIAAGNQNSSVTFTSGDLPAASEKYVKFFLYNIKGDCVGECTESLYIVSGLTITETLTADKINESEENEEVSPIVIWEGSTDLGTDWSAAVTIGKDDFADCTTEGYFVLTGQATGSGAQIAVQDDDAWANMPLVVNGSETSGTVTFTGTELTFSFTEESLQKAKSGGVHIKGQNVTITKLVYYPKSSSSNGGTTGNNTPSGELSATASDNAKKLYKFICDNYGAKVISGQMDMCWSKERDMAKRVYEDTGKYPALMGFDFMNYTSIGWVDNGLNQTELAIKWGTGTYDYDYTYTGHKGGIVAFCWHWRDPLAPSGTTGEFYSQSNNNPTTNFRIPYKDNGLDTSSDAFTAITEDLDVIAAELTKLKNAGVPVLWRPMHEGAGNRYIYNDGKAWFWWGAGTDIDGRTDNDKAYIALWQYMHDYFTNEKGLDNLIWVWNGQATQFYPGDEYCDIVGTDIYAPSYDYSSQIAKFNECKTMSAPTSKIIALTETGIIPSIENIQRDGAWWSYFMVWNDGDLNNDNSDGNFWTGTNKMSSEHKRSVYNSEYVITLDELPDLTTYGD